MLVVVSRLAFCDVTFSTNDAFIVVSSVSSMTTVVGPSSTRLVISDSGSSDVIIVSIEFVSTPMVVGSSLIGVVVRFDTSTVVLVGIVVLSVVDAVPVEVVVVDTVVVEVAVVVLAVVVWVVFIDIVVVEADAVGIILGVVVDRVVVEAADVDVVVGVVFAAVVVVVVVVGDVVVSFKIMP